MFARFRRQPPAPIPPAPIDLSALRAKLEALAENTLAEEARTNPFNVVPLCRYGEKLRTTNPAAYKELVAAVDLRMFAPLRHEYMRDLTPFERETFFEIALKGAQMPESIASTIRFVEYLEQAEIPGDMVECGVFLGATPYVVGKTLMNLGRIERRMYLYDTYEGMPKPQAVDVPYGAKAGKIEWHADWMRGPLGIVRENVALSGYPLERVSFVKGMVEDTIPGTIPERIAFLRLDTDFYSSTKHELEHLYPRLVKGGVLVLDDYGFFLGAKKATDEYFAAQGVVPCLFRIDEHVRALIKP